VSARRGRRRRGAALLGAALLVACSSPADTASDAPAPPASPGEATGQLRQFRADIVRRVVQVTVDAAQPLQVVQVALQVQGLAPLPPTPLDVAVPAGGRVDLTVPYGAATCGQAPGAAVATLTVRRAEGSTAEVVLPLRDDGLVARLHGGECAEVALRDSVDLRVGDAWTEALVDGQLVLTGTLRLVRKAPGRTVVLQELGANVILSVRSDRPPPLLVLGPEQQAGEVPVELRAARCDAHALTESKRTSLLNVYAGLDAQSPRLTTVVPDPASRARIEAFAVTACRALGVR
jgi:hypothetical protein